MISESVTPKVSQKDLLNFFWHHLEKDIDILSFILQRSEMDSSVLIHSILHNMVTVEVDLCEGMLGLDNVNALVTKFCPSR